METPMSTETKPPQVIKVAPEPPQTGPRESIVDDRLRKTQQQVRGVDVAAGLLTLVIGSVAYLFVAALIDHWLLVGGLGFWGRLLTLFVLLALGGAYFYHNVLRPLLLRINPIYVAHTIENSHPSLKNSLVNFLLLRRGQREVSPAVYRAIEHRAAEDVAGVAPETAVDRRHLIRLSYVLTALVAMGAIYHVVSPKNPLTSAFRVMLPWASISAPTRVTIEDIQPGDKVVFHGEELTVSAEVHGQRDEEPVLLYYTTADGQSIDQAVPMTVPEGKYRHQCKLPPDSFGLQQDLEYYLAVGDCRSERFSVTVQIAPSILVDAVEYDYPDYTGIPDRIAQNQGDLRAIEGTRVTLRATANTGIDRAEIDLDCDGLRGLVMTADAKKATGRFTLRMRPDDPSRPEHESYQLRFTDVAGRENRQPIRHEIEVIPDLPPEVALVDPPEESIQLPENGSLELKIRAEDPDFALREVTLRAERAGKGLPIRPLLSRLSSAKPHEGPFEGTMLFEPAKLDLKAGDQVTYWAEAKDNKEPISGHAETERRWITIVEPSQDQTPQDQPDQKGDRPEENQQDQSPEQKPDQQEPQEKPDQQKDPDQQEDSGEQQQPAGEEGQAGQGQPEGDQKDSPAESQPGEEGQQGQSQEDSAGAGDQGQQQDQAADKPSEPLDGETNPGDVFEEVLKQQEKQKENQQQQGQEQQGQEQQGQKQQGQKQQGQEQQGQEQQGQKQQGGQQTGQEQTGQEQPGQKQTGQKQSGQRQPGEGKGSQPEGTGERAEEKSGSKQQGEEKSGSKQQGEESEAEGGDPRQGKDASGDEQSSGEAPRTTPQEAKREGDKTPQEQQSEKSQDREPGSAAENRDESDAQGDTSGDRSGEGEEGAGQRSDQSGTGAAGRNTESEQGSSKGQQQGEGETGTKPGDQAEAERPIGRPDEQERPGEGSKSRRKPGQDRSDAKPEDRKSQQDASQDRQDDSGQSGEGEAEGERSGRPGEQGAGSPTGGGKPGDRQAVSPPSDAEEPGGDAFNKEYADKRTDLALEYLKDQLAKEQPDKELLDALGGWTRDDLEKFTRRWQAMKQAAAGQGDQAKAARSRLNESLRSLGLRGSRAELRSGTKADQLRGVRDSRRIAPPSGWEEQIRAYRRSIGGGR